MAGCRWKPVDTCRAFVSFLVLAILSLGAVAAEEKQEDWQPPVSLRENFDWIQLTSDEWLKGEFIAMYERDLEFDSDELGILTLD